MPKVMPSQIVKSIDAMFSTAKPDDAINSYTSDHSAMFASIVDLVDQAPDELIQCSGDDYADLVLAKSTIRNMLANWAGSGAKQSLPVIKGTDAVKVIRRVMVKLPDENPPAAHASLEFIGDPELRESIGIDIGGAHRATINAEWKAATVLAGAAIEALLHWKLAQFEEGARDAAPRAPKVSGQPKALNDYVLHDYIAVAEDLKIIDTNTAAAARLAKNYRNLIHPGRVERLQARCSRATAHSAVGAMGAVIEALS